MEWAKIRRAVSSVGELVRLLPKDSPSREAALGGRLYWEEVLAIVEEELGRENSRQESDDQYAVRLSQVREKLLHLTEFWKRLSLPETALVPVTNQILLNQVLNLRRRRTYSDSVLNLRREQVDSPVVPFSQRK